MRHKFSDLRVMIKIYFHAGHVYIALPRTAFIVRLILVIMKGDTK